MCARSTFSSVGLIKHSSQFKKSGVKLRNFTCSRKPKVSTFWPMSFVTAPYRGKVVKISYKTGGIAILTGMCIDLPVGKAEVLCGDIVHWQ